MDEMHQRVDQALADFELAPYRKVPPHHLSGGEKQRLAIAATLIMRPRYLVLDEPTALLDPQHRRQIIELLHVLRNQYGVATILVTHVPEEAENVSRIIALKERNAHDGFHQRCFRSRPPTAIRTRSPLFENQLRVIRPS